MVVDIILVVFFVVAAIWGAYKGGVKIIASLVSFALAFVLAYTLAGTVGEHIRSTSFGTSIEQAIETRILNESDEDVSVDENQEEVSTEIEKKDAVTKIEEMLGEKVDEVVNENKEALAQKIVSYVFVGIGFLATFIGVKLVLFIAFLIVELIFKLPVLKTFNRLIGCVLEIVLMLLKVWIVLALVSFVAPLDFMEDVVELINSSVITKALYDHNIIVSLIIGEFI